MLMKTGHIAAAQKLTLTPTETSFRSLPGSSIYIYREREIEREREIQREIDRERER